MESVFICAFLLAFAESSFAIQVCNEDVPNTLDIIISCPDPKRLKYPNYNDLTTYYTCSNTGQTQLESCPANQYFCYYRQNCGPCTNFFVPPDCEFFSERMNATCVKKVTTTPRAPTSPTTAKPSTIRTPSPIISTTARPPVTPRPSRTTPSSVPTPPSQSTPSSDIPMPPMVVTPVPGIPTPPNENITPPSIPGTPPMLTTIKSF